MSAFAFPYGSIDNDRLYDESDFCRFFASMLSDGVFVQNTDTALRVTADGSGLTVTVAAGAANRAGRLLGLDADQSVDLTDYIDATLPRIVRVCMRDNAADRVAEVVVVAGTPSTTPTAPAIQRGGDYNDLCLAEIAIAAGSAAISQAAITDTRPDMTLCGYVRCLAEKIDLSGLIAQFEGWFEDHKTTAADDLDTLEGTFSEYLDRLEDELAQLHAGTATMLKAVYDPAQSGKTFADVAQNAAELTAVKTACGSVTVTLSAAGWVDAEGSATGTAAPYIQTVAVEGMTADRNFAPLYATWLSDMDAYGAAQEAAALINGGGTTSENAMTFICRAEKPTIDVSITMQGVL